MRKINELFTDFSQDLSQALRQGGEPVRNYSKTLDSKIYKPENARFKLVVWFKDGNKRYFYSYDNQHLNKSVHTDEYAALIKLLRLPNKYAGLFKNIIIYATLDPQKATSSNFNYEILKVDIYGNKKTNQLVNFITTQKNITLDIQRLANLSNPRI